MKLTMMDYFEMRRKIIQFLNESGITPFDLMRVGKGLCCCRTCKFFVQHYSKDGIPVDFGHCVKGNTPKSKKPNMQNCGFWTLDDENTVVMGSGKDDK